ncbi:SAM-dependent methyltransferase [Tamilnaduibacter salinus]|uniref:SAM-dependent methyltransferase n=1 Tax=Tamilnaduibacter salinus TaxID=1484056 RepID=A0A2A2I5S9_9GAMM|nr:class I SAM-dependent methyltransferase [Tamilnaduibacter salinus]PAV26393.1 SAM-dependent methyltransferase [Tamilnaduibacter salinus]
MNFYEERILPHLIDCACSNGQVMKLRKAIVPNARGQVLEIGMGSGINLGFYDPDKVSLVYGLEPSRGMRRKAAAHLAQSPVRVEWLDLPGETVPLADNSVDTVLLTFTLCTIPDWFQALKEMKRVLRPEGRLLFCEHGQSPDPGVRRWQDRLTPGWKRLAGGCHLNRPIHRLIAEAGFTIDAMETRYLPKAPRFAGYIYSGEATPTA